MADDKSNTGNQDRSRVSAEQGYELEYFSQKHGISREQARWSPRDRQIRGAGGFIGRRLGPRILRTETAGLAAIAALQSRYGDLG